MSELRRDIPSLSTGPNQTLAEYLANNSLTFVRLEAVRKKVVAPATYINVGHLLVPFQGWDNPEGDRYWQNRREQSDTATEDAAQTIC